ncbi:MAG: hypothetical protein V5A44_05930 [Haloarculaceae archaeon]
MRLTVKPLKKREPGDGMAVIDRQALGEAGLSGGDFVAVEGYVGADVEAVCREAAAVAVREHVHAAAAGADRDPANLELTADHFERPLDEVDPSSAEREFEATGFESPTSVAD